MAGFWGIFLMMALVSVLLTHEHNRAAEVFSSGSANLLFWFFSWFLLWRFRLLLGKSTIAALLERFYDVSEGVITLDGHNIKDLDPSWLRRKVIGFIRQVISRSISSALLIRIEPGVVKLIFPVMRECCTKLGWMVLQQSANHCIPHSKPGLQSDSLTAPILFGLQADSNSVILLGTYCDGWSL